MKYIPAPEWTQKTQELIARLEMKHVLVDRVVCFKSEGSQSRRTIARIHTMPKIIQLGLQQPAFYAIELISERFDKQSEEEKIKTLIHELMHIPHSFNGGFRMHKPFVTHAKVDAMYRKLGSPNPVRVQTHLLLP